jgi:hypothetical protein
VKSFFISYNQADRQWAEWIAWHLEEAGYTTVLQAWDFRPGSNFVVEMQAAISKAERTIAVLSPDFLRSAFTQPEWSAAFGSDPTGEHRRLVPVRVSDCKADGLLSQIVFIDLVGLVQEQAATVLLEGVKAVRIKPAVEPGFPGIRDRTVPEAPAFPANPEMGRFRVGAQTPPSPTGSDWALGPKREAWLLILNQILQIPEARNAVVACQVDCDAMCQQIDDLMNYKDLHDHLHQLQFNCYEPIVRSTRAYTIDEDVRDALAEYELNLQVIIEALWEIDGRLDSESSGADWIQSLADAHQDLREGIEHSNAAQLRRATGSIRRVLERQPSRINDRIMESARELRLERLVQALADVCDQLTDRHIDPEKASEFRSGLTGMSRLTVDLNATRDRHAEWQKLDVDLRLIDVCLDRSADELFETWPDVWKCVDPLSRGVQDPWAIQFRAAARRVDQAVMTRDANTTDLFRKFRRHASIRFYKVDTNMKRLCEQLHRTGRPLAVMLKVIQ